MKNFFEFQKLARKKSNNVLIVFGLMLLALVFAFNLCVYYGLQLMHGSEDPISGDFWILPQPAFDTQICLVGFFILCFVLAYIKQLMKYRSDPMSIVFQLGGIALNDRGTKLTSKEQKLLNIVEEMCIAAGIPVVPVFVLENESTINAFTSGHNLATAHIVTTQGALDELTRDELQAVIAHEVGHIVSADVKVNSVLLSCIVALTFLVTLGLKMMEFAGRSRGRSSKDNSSVYLIVIGLFFMLIGAVGAFLGRVLQSLFSRKREYLADSLGVQFTRNPSGLAGALAKIRDIFRSEIYKADSLNIAHMCIANPLSSGFFSGLMASHPPINSRIELLDPKYLDPSYNLERSRTSEELNQRIDKRNKKGQFVIDQTNILEGILVQQPVMANILAKEGLINLDNLNISKPLHSDIEFKYSVWGLLISKEESVKKNQISILQNLYGDKFDSAKVPKIDIDSHQKLELSASVFSIVIPQMKKLNEDDKKLFIKSIKLISDADSNLSEFELILLASLFVAIEVKVVKYKINFLAVRQILSVFVKLSQSKDKHFEIFVASLKTFYGKDIKQAGLKLEDVKFDDLVFLFHGLKNSSVELKQHICSAVLVALKQDQILTLKEIEAFRVFSMALGIPSPPVIALSIT